MSDEDQGYEYEDTVLDREHLDDIDPDFVDDPIDAHAVNMPQTEQLIHRVVELLESAPGLPMSSSVRVNRDEILELLDDAVGRMPEELRAARWLLKEREEFLAKTRRDADEIIAEATARAGHMVQRTEVVKAADARARKVLEEAEAEARRLKYQAEDYCDQKLASFEIVLDRVMRTVSAGRHRLSATSLAQSELAPDTSDSTGGAADFFNQDDDSYFDDDRAK